MPDTILVIPCYDEYERFPGEAFAAFAEAQPRVGFVLVDDGSRDRTLERLEQLAARDPRRFQVLPLAANHGKAEAVRLGISRAFDTGARFVGYWDADLAAPLAEVPRFIELLEEHAEREIVFGSRVMLLGRSIRRSALRHYLGRVFATAVSRMLDLAIYDTQCGAKLFRSSADMRRLFETPFVVNWTFDVEIIARLIRLRRESGGPRPRDTIYEHPLRQWHDVAGSKVRPLDFVKGLAEVARIHRTYLRAGARPLARAIRAPAGPPA